MSALLAMFLLAVPEGLSPPPPPPPVTAPRVPTRPETPPEPPPEVLPEARIHLTASVPGAELHYASSPRALCRAPCGVLLGVDPKQQFQIVAPGFKTSNEFAIGELTGDVQVNFVPRDETLFALGKGFTIAGVVFAGIGYLSAVAWVAIVLVGNLFAALFTSLFRGTPGGFWLGPTEMLWVALGGVVIGGPMLGYGIPTMVRGRERLDVTGPEASQ